VAATGLLGFNPYGKAQALDFSSKPTQLAIQLQQKEQAKAEAYEKYFMDYEKSLNPAGLAQGESREFLNKYNRIKENWIKNKQSILNPARYGYEAQAEYSALLKDAVSYIDLGKQATAERKAYSTTLSQARKAGKNIEGDLEVTANAMKTVGLGYEAPDISRVDIFDPYDDRKFMQNVWGTAELPTRVINKDIGGGKVIPETYYLKIPEMVTQAPERLKDAEIGTRGYVRNNRGAGKYFKTLMADERLLAEANKVYKEYKGQGAKINDEEDFAVAYGLIKKPGGFVKAGKEEETAAYTRAQQEGKSKRLIDYNNQNQAPTTHLFDIFGSGIGLTTKNADIKDGTARKKDGGLYSGNIVIPKEQLPSDFSAALLAAGISKSNVDGAEYLTVNYKNGKAISVSSETLGVINEKAMAKYQDALNKNVYGIKGQVQRITGEAMPPAKKEEMTTAEKMRRLANQNK
jgi:hypothetical protein